MTLTHNNRFTYQIDVVPPFPTYTDPQRSLWMNFLNITEHEINDIQKMLCCKVAVSTFIHPWVIIFVNWWWWHVKRKNQKCAVLKFDLQQNYIYKENFVGPPLNFRSPLKFRSPPKFKFFEGAPQIFRPEIFRSPLKMGGGWYHG